MQKKSHKTKTETKKTPTQQQPNQTKPPLPKKHPNQSRKKDTKIFMNHTEPKYKDLKLKTTNGIKKFMTEVTDMLNTYIMVKYTIKQEILPQPVPNSRDN